MPRTNEAAVGVPLPPHVVVTTFLFDADFEQCNQFRDVAGVERFSRGDAFEHVLEVMSREPHTNL